MAGGGGSDRRSYDHGASSEAQRNIQGVIGQLEQVMTARDAQVKAVMGDFQADGVSEEYHAKEQRWKNASQEVRNIIALLRKTLEQNDSTAQQTVARAKTAVDNIG
ncbi:pore-forming ESAT-6 family protein [Kitasatospora aureofaciens]|uniref:pore-forming ESAT-6 family protein n=1 Tax=Kitasatospora aureofaciens TaxID=1894 RepID=UPI001C453D23|nr:pore-forming ESAT-6 family protein [Kitasatospora aureofaciens]MBV6701390.1 pore-forming ESAT-6 family protein [Kitasatospora aureofaciens]